MRVKIKKLHQDAIIPQYQTHGSAGFDLHAIEKCVLKAGSIALIKTGLAMEIESGFELQIRPRSGLALKNQITVLNSPGTIDSDYRGEIMVVLYNHSQQDFVVNEGDRVAQGVIARYEKADFELCTQLSDTHRGSGGFGSSGV